MKTPLSNRKTPYTTSWQKAVVTGICLIFPLCFKPYDTAGTLIKPYASVGTLKGIHLQLSTCIININTSNPNIKYDPG